jgi:hypothetical protein
MIYPEEGKRGRYGAKDTSSKSAGTANLSRRRLNEARSVVIEGFWCAPINGAHLFLILVAGIPARLASSGRHAYHMGKELFEEITDEDE